MDPITIGIGAALVWWLSGKGDKAVKSGVRKVARAASKAGDALFSESDDLAPAGVSSRVDVVLKPCARGKAPHTWPSERQAARIAAKSDGNGILPDACMVCGEER